MEAFKSRLRTLRREHRLSQRALADQIDVSQGHLAKLESGKRLPSREVVDRLAAVFARSGAELVRGTNEAVRYAETLAAPDRDELLHTHDAEEKTQQQRTIEATAYTLRTIQQLYCDLVALFEAQHGGLLGIETERALELFATVRQCFDIYGKPLRSLEEEIGPIYIPDALFQKPVPPECAGEEYDYEMKPRLHDTQHRLDAFVADFFVRYPDADRNMPDITSLRPAIDELGAFRKREEQAFFERAKAIARERGFLTENREIPERRRARKPRKQ
jgi:transcriptional regulator with XRE-family HTH domain